MAFLIVKYRKMREGEKKTLRHLDRKGHLLIKLRGEKNQ